MGEGTGGDGGDGGAAGEGHPRLLGKVLFLCYRVPKKKVGLAKYYFLGHKQAYCAFHKFLAH